MTGLLETVGIDPSCFATFSAENEPDIAQYFVRPPYYSEVVKRGTALQSLILFGERGAGKSASRIAFSKEMWTAISNQKPAPLVITLSDFSRILSGGIERVNLGAFVAEIGYLTMEAILIWLSALDEAERATNVEGLTDKERATVAALVNRFYLSHPSLVRDASIEEPLKLINLAWHKRTQLWIESRWDAIRGLIGDLAGVALKRGLDVDSHIDESLKELLKADTKVLSNGLHAKAFLQKLVLTAKIFGFPGIVVLVDKVDETPATSNSYEATAKVVFPILATTALLEISGFGWLFFLWDRVKGSYESEPLKIRLDKIANAPIRWDRDQLRDLVRSRLKHFSRDEGTIGFVDLCANGMDPVAVLDKAIELSMNSPRELVRILDTVIREHDERAGQGHSGPKLTTESVNLGFDKYVKDRITTVFDEMHVKYVARLASKKFINKDVQQAFKISDQAARARIDNWAKSGLVRFSGVRSSDGESSGKPPNEYVVADSRMIWALDRKLIDAGEQLD